MDDKCQLVLSFSFPEDLSLELSEVSEFHHLVRDYFNLLTSLCVTPLARGIKLEHKIKLKTPAWYWLERFMESTDPKQNKRYRPIKKFIFVQEGKYEMAIGGHESLNTAAFEAKRKVKEVNTVIFHLLSLVKTENLDYEVPRPLASDDGSYILVDLEKGELLYRGKLLKKMTKSKFPFVLLQKWAEIKEGIPINVLEGYSADDIEIGIRNFKSDLKKHLEKMPQVEKRIEESFIVRKPNNKIIVDGIFLIRE
ncbi:MAG: hypothetical protein AAB383_00895 [Patescibacteria group bacterium]